MKGYKLKKYLFVTALVLVAVVWRWYWERWPVIKVDLATYELWGRDTIIHGLKNYYANSDSDYTPGYILILWLVSKIYWWFLNKGIVFDVDYAYRVVPVLADGLNIFLVYRLISKLNLKKRLNWLLIFLAFWPAWWIVSARWGQTDGVVMSFLLISLLAIVEDRGWLSAIFLGFAQAIKPIAVFSLPLYIAYLLKSKRNKEVIVYLLLFGLSLLACYLPLNGDDNLLTFMISRQWTVAKTWPLLSVNGLNLWGVVSGFKEGVMNRVQIGSYLGISQAAWGGLVFVLFWISSFLNLNAAKNRQLLNVWLLRALAITYCSMFMFLTGMHERHLYYGLFFGLLAGLTGTGWLWLGGLSLFYWWNLKYSIWHIHGEGPVWTSLMAYLTVVLGNVSFLWGWWYMIKDKSLGHNKVRHENKS